MILESNDYSLIGGYKNISKYPYSSSRYLLYIKNLVFWLYFRYHFIIINNFNI